MRGHGQRPSRSSFPFYKSIRIAVSNGQILAGFGQLSLISPIYEIALKLHRDDRQSENLCVLSMKKVRVRSEVHSHGQTIRPFYQFVSVRCLVPSRVHTSNSVFFILGEF